LDFLPTSSAGSIRIISLAIKAGQKDFDPGQFIYCENFQEKFQAMSREKQLKSAVLRSIIRNKISEDFALYGYIKNL
jgi:hypothetical protein